jgi:uncharacterized protein
MAPPANRDIIETAFEDWAAGRRSFYDLCAADASITIMGQSRFSGTFSKDAFLRERARPFVARFSTPIVPANWKIWAEKDDVIARWDSHATACDGKPYNNSYAFFITMKDGRATSLTMFLDMSAFEDVWNRCQP